MNYDGRHGIALIINNINWQKDENKKPYMDTRVGAQKVAEALKDSLETIRYKVEYVEDLTRTRMIEKLEKVREHIAATDDSFICCISTHGNEYGVYGIDGRPRINPEGVADTRALEHKPVSIDSLSELFEPRACANLKGKPKIFFIQSCRGQKPSKPIEDVKSEPHKPEDVKSKPHKPEDVESEPHKPEDVESEPHKPEDVKSKPHKPEDVESEPHKPEDVESEPHKPEDVESKPHKPEDVESEPHKPEDVKSKPHKPEDVESEPHKPEDVKSKPHKPEDVESKPHKPEDVKSKPHKPEDVESEPHKPEDVKSEPQPSLTRKLDFYFSYATDPGHCSKQKLYLRFLSETLNELSAECSLDYIITHVHRKVAAENGNVQIGDDVYQHQQAPQVVQQMRGPVYFQ